MPLQEAAKDGSNSDSDNAKNFKKLEDIMRGIVNDPSPLLCAAIIDGSIVMSSFTIAPSNATHPQPSKTHGAKDDHTLAEESTSCHGLGDTAVDALLVQNNQLTEASSTPIRKSTQNDEIVEEIGNIPAGSRKLVSTLAELVPYSPMPDSTTTKYQPTVITPLEIESLQNFLGQHDASRHGILLEFFQNIQASTMSIQSNFHTMDYICFSDQTSPQQSFRNKSDPSEYVADYIGDQFRICQLCDNCKFRDHRLDQCIGPVGVNGRIYGCPLCNRVNHLLETCKLLQKLGPRYLDILRKWLVVLRNNKPMLESSMTHSRLIEMARSSNNREERSCAPLKEEYAKCMNTLYPEHHTVFMYHNNYLEDTQLVFYKWLQCHKKKPARSG